MENTKFSNRMQCIGIDNMQIVLNNQVPIVKVEIKYTFFNCFPHKYLFQHKKTWSEVNIVIEEI